MAGGYLNADNTITKHPKTYKEEEKEEVIVKPIITKNTPPVTEPKKEEGKS